MKVAVSYLSSSDYEKCIKKINQTKADMLHVDMCDGKYVSANNFEMPKLKQILSKSLKPLDMHLMVNNPSKYFADLKDLKVMSIAIHLDSSLHVLEDIKKIKSLNIKAGIAINPDQDVNLLMPYLPLIDHVIVMSVIPGRGGQKFIMETTSKLTKLSKLKEKYHFLIEVDGGINSETIKLVKDTADIVVSGSYITNNNDYEKAIESLR